MEASCAEEGGPWGLEEDLAAAEEEVDACPAEEAEDATSEEEVSECRPESQGLLPSCPCLCPTPLGP